MNVPIPPTDNLYKFAALLGSIIVLASLYIPRLMLIELQEKRALVELKIDTTTAEQDFVMRKMDTVKNITHNSIAYKKGLWKPDKDKLELTYSDDELKKLLAEQLELVKATSISVAELKHLGKSLNRLSSDVKLVYWIAMASSIIGCLLAGWGYFMWYYRIQIYQDIAIKDSAGQTKQTG